MKELKDRIVAGERAAIAKAITLVESSRDEDIQQSHELISQLIKSPGHAIRVGSVSYTHLTLPTKRIV